MNKIKTNTLKKIEYWKVNIDNTKEILNKKMINTININCQKYFSSKIPEDYYNQLLSVANNWFWVQMDEDDVKNHLYNSSEVYIIKYKWKIIWFSSIIYIEWLIYRYWTVISKDYQWKWIYKHLSQYLPKKRIYFLRTQNLNIINSLKKQWYIVFIWKDAIELLKEKINEKNLLDFFIKLDWWHNYLDKNWVFKGLYWHKMWKEWNITHINNYNWFKYKDWDSLLVLYNEKDNEK